MSGGGAEGHPAGSGGNAEAHRDTQAHRTPEAHRHAGGAGLRPGRIPGSYEYSALAVLALLGSGTAWYRRRRHV